MMSPIPSFRPDRTLPEGKHKANWSEVNRRYGFNGPRKEQLQGLERAILELKSVGCTRIWLNGSFVTKKAVPGDYDCCYDTEGMDMVAFRLAYPVLSNVYRNEEQKQIVRGEFYAADAVSMLGITVLELFQLVNRIPTDLVAIGDKAAEKELRKLMKKKKGIIELEIGGIS